MRDTDRMRTLMLVTTRWPHGEFTEFVEAEIPHLLNHFDKVRVAPTYPRGPVVWDVPSGVEVDYSLAEALVARSSPLGERSRLVRAARNVARPNPAGLGFTRADLAADLTNPTWWRMLLMARAEANIVRRWATSQQPPDVAYTYWLGSKTLGMRQAWPGIPVVSRGHGSEVYPFSVGLHSLPYQREWVLACDRVACVSQHGQEFLGSLYPDAADRLEVRRLGIPDPMVLAPDGNYPESLKVLSASAMKPNKRVGLIAAAVAELAREGVPTHWTHLGDGPDQARVEEVLASAPATLTWKLPGLVAVEEVRAEMATGGYDVFANASLSEGAPVSVMEAQAVGIPTVATDVGGSAEVAQRDVNVIVDRDITPTTLAQALLAAASLDPALRPVRRQRWYENYDAATNYEAFARELAALAGVPNL